MHKFIIRLLGLKGSWAWACRQMGKGLIVRPSTAKGSVKYRISRDKQRRIQWCFIRQSPKELDWGSANIFFNDFEDTNWEIWRE